jgi:hypothetical protein
LKLFFAGDGWDVSVSLTLAATTELPTAVSIPDARNFLRFMDEVPFIMSYGNCYFGEATHHLTMSDSE